MHSYNQEIKKVVRENSLKKAVEILTRNRFQSTLSPLDYLQRVKEYLVKKESEPYLSYINQLSSTTINRWENFYKSIVNSKNASELKVAYLCGPNPLNDLSVFVDNGILPENIWAFEVDDETYNEAIIRAIHSNYPYLKIIKSDLSNFLSNSPIKFDIIYLDFCGPLPNRNQKQKNLKNIMSIFYNQNLYSPGVLLTNFSLPTEEQDSKGRSLIKTNVINYLFPKDFIESGDIEKNENFIEGPIVYSYVPETWYDVVDKDLENYYGQYITRVINDMATLIVPYQRFANNEVYLKRFFGKIFVSPSSNNFTQTFINEIIKFKDFTDDWDGGDVEVDPGMYPLLYTLKLIKKSSDENGEYKKFADLFLNQMSCSKDRNSFEQNIEIMHYLMTQNIGVESYYSDSLLILEKKWNDFRKPVFCDVFMFHQLKDLLVRQLAVPYHLNFEKSERWTYKAKETQMFLDLLVFDECRYLYDWMPTIDMLEYNLNNPEIELSFRFILDGVAKHRSWYNNEFFFGTASIDNFTEGFNAKTLKPRKIM